MEPFFSEHELLSGNKVEVRNIVVDVYDLRRKHESSLACRHGICLVVWHIIENKATKPPGSNELAKAIWAADRNQRICDSATQRCPHPTRYRDLRRDRQVNKEVRRALT